MKREGYFIWLFLELKNKIIQVLPTGLVCQSSAHSLLLGLCPKPLTGTSVLLILIYCRIGAVSVSYT